MQHNHLQPLLAQEFNITIIEASSFTAVIMLFLAIAPIFMVIFRKNKCKKSDDDSVYFTLYHKFAIEFC